MTNLPKKIYRSLGDTPGEFLGNLVLLILVGPIWLLLNAIAYAWGFIGMVLRFPNPKQIPPVVTDDDLPAEKKAKIYINQFKKSVADLTVATDTEKSTSKISNQHAKVEVWWDDDMVGISIDKLNTGFWHTLEEGNIDLHFWIAVGALRNGIKWKQNSIGRKEGWIYSDEMEVWVVVSSGDSSYTYFKYKRRFK